MTLQTIADRVGVSRMTVSNAFSRPDQLSRVLRDRILAAADELGYVGPDPAARALARGTTGAVGILLTDSLSYAFSDSVATAFLGAIAEELTPTGLALTLLTASSTSDVVPARDVAMDGALVYSCDPASPAVDLLTRRGLPLVHIDQVPQDGLTSVNVADRDGARAAAEHLVSLGHHRVALLMSGLHGPHGLIDPVASDLDGYASKQRLAGWLDALGPAGALITAARVPEVAFDDVRQATRLLLDRPDRPTAVLCFSDVIAIAVIDAARELGLSVPGDVSVVGFDDSPAALRFRPALTTVRQDVVHKGRAAAAALIAAMRGEAKPEQLLLPTELIIRDSTGPAARPPGTSPILPDGDAGEHRHGGGVDRAGVVAGTPEGDPDQAGLQ
ncbi:LacI family DNA-binding transcriptional regulator [Winogradskya humida]|uniref:LacI family DNA-binding transcriptional regulator n=1 Tax=Winogradskya humida TaxID=113566 RepID=UPI001EF269C4|nr:LacI family DNA-binding transcriptional regulator [Actinoplanes humidus]